MTIREQLARNLAYYRKKSGFTQKEAAKRLGTKLTTISSWERGVSQPSADMLVSIAMLYKVSLSDLCGADYGYIAPYSPEEQLLIDSYRKADDHEKLVIQKILSALAQGDQK